jgi:RNA polymerase sigma-70 factor (ECF subfamily)
MQELELRRGAKASQTLDALTPLYEQYAPRILMYMQYRCDDSAAAQDLAAQVFERALQGLHRFHHEGDTPLSAWLFGIARHVVTDWQRQQYVRKFLPWDHFTRRASGEPGPEQIALESEERQRLRQALTRLSSRERDVLGLRFSSELTNRQIAKMLGLSESNVAVILFRTMQKLRQIFAEDEAATCAPFLSQPEVDHE